MSNLSDSVYETIKEAFPHFKVKKEYFIFFRGKKLFFDFYIPELRLLIEVQGNQHSTFVEFFHNTAEGYRAQKQRDSFKREWADTEGYKLIEILWSDIPLSKPKFLKIIGDLC